MPTDQGAETVRKANAIAKNVVNAIDSFNERFFRCIFIPLLEKSGFFFKIALFLSFVNKILSKNRKITIL